MPTSDTSLISPGIKAIALCRLGARSGHMICFAFTLSSLTSAAMWRQVRHERSAQVSICVRRFGARVHKRTLSARVLCSARLCPARSRSVSIRVSLHVGARPGKFMWTARALQLALAAACVSQTSSLRVSPRLSRRGFVATLGTALASSVAPAHAGLGPADGLFPDCPMQDTCVSSQDDRPQSWDNPWDADDPPATAMARLRQIIERKLKGTIIEADDRYIRAEFVSSGVGGDNIDDAEFFFVRLLLSHEPSLARLGCGGPAGWRSRLHWMCHHTFRCCRFRCCFFRCFRFRILSGGGSRLDSTDQLLFCAAGTG